MLFAAKSGAQGRCTWLLVFITLLPLLLLLLLLRLPQMPR
jgi:hypothetical protein